MHEQAITCFEAALTLQPNYLDALNNLGNSLRIVKRSKEAIKAFRTAIDIDPNFFEGHHNLANTLQDLNQLEEAALSYRRALEINPDFDETKKNLGTCLLGCGSHREGLQYLQQSCGVIEFTGSEKPDWRLLYK